jgi:Zn-dependent oligopeptidase
MSIDTNLTDSWQKFVNNFDKTKKAFETISNPVAPVVGVENTAGGAAKSAANTAEKTAKKVFNLPSFDSIITVIIGIILVVLGIVFIGESNKTIQTITKAVAS